MISIVTTLLCVCAAAATFAMHAVVAMNYNPGNWSGVIIVGCWDTAVYAGIVFAAMRLRRSLWASSILAISACLIGGLSVFVLYLWQRPFFVPPTPTQHVMNCVGPLVEIGLPLLQWPAFALFAGLAYLCRDWSRPAAQFSLRWLFVLTALVAVVLSMTITYGVGQGVGATLAGCVLLPGIKKRNWGLILMGTVLAGLTVLSTRTVYQYSRSHAEEIIAAASELMDRFPNEERMWSNDDRVPEILRNLGASSVTVYTNHVYVYVGGHCGEGFLIYRSPHPASPIGSDCWKINERLWYYEGA